MIPESKSHDEVRNQQIKDMGKVIKQVSDESHDVGFKEGLKRTAIFHPLQESGSRSVVLRDANDEIIADVYGPIEKMKTLPNGLISIHVGSRGTVVLHAHKKEDYGKEKGHDLD